VLNQQDVKPLPTESDAHVLSRHFRAGVRILLIASLVATIAAVLSKPEVAYFAAIPIPILYAALAFANHLETRSRVSELRDQGTNRLGKKEIEVNVETAGIILLMKVIGVLINLPFLPLFFVEAERDEMHDM
jgi:hypothetical protein